MTTFEFTPPGGEALDSQGGADRHGNALAVIAVFAIGALALAVLTASKPAATAVAVSGVIALLVFLLVDLPDANAVGTLNDARESFFDAEAVPQGGFWLEMVGRSRSPSPASRWPRSPRAARRPAPAETQATGRTGIERARIQARRRPHRRPSREQARGRAAPPHPPPRARQRG